jgi:THO complex subunit 7
MFCRSIQALESDMVTIRAEHETQAKTIQNQKAALDTIISQLGTLRFLTKEPDADGDIAAPSPTGTPIPETVTEEDLVEAASDEKTAAGGDDIEMGELEEGEKEEEDKKKVAEDDLEEGEATDMSSPLSDIPDN